MDSRQLSILKTISYSDVFDHPLSLSEIHYFLQTDKIISLSDVKKVLSAMSPYILQENGYFAFSEKKTIITNRLLSKKIGDKKVALARKIAGTLMAIPSVQFIGISGGVAGGSVTDRDDIDIFVITHRGTLYTTRLFLLLLLELMGRRRRRKQIQAKDKICLNMLIDEASLPMPINRQDLYTAREIAQIIPLFERNNMYTSFLQANTWTRNFLPHAKGRSGFHSLQNSWFPAVLFRGIEPFIRLAQSILMKRHRTSEEIGFSFLALHPRDMRKHIMTEYEKRLRHYIKSYTI